jgi:predicted transcriptional regulator
MYQEVALELHDETLIKLDKLASERGLTRDELINQSLQELLDETESSGS